MILDTRKETCATMLQRACCPRAGCPCVVRIILDLHLSFLACALGTSAFYYV